MKEYGSKEDKKTDGKPSKDTVSVDSNNNLNGSTAEYGDSQTDVEEQPSEVVTDSENTEAVEQIQQRVTRKAVQKCWHLIRKLKNQRKQKISMKIMQCM